MRLLEKVKEGGPESKVWGYFLIEVKSLFSCAVLHFLPGSREAYHSHAFNAVSWIWKGQLEENFQETGKTRTYFPSFKPIFTPRERFHKVISKGDTWVITFRGPWVDKWREYLPQNNQYITLTHGRNITID